MLVWGALTTIKEILEHATTFYIRIVRKTTGTNEPPKEEKEINHEKLRISRNELVLIATEEKRQRK